MKFEKDFKFIINTEIYEQMKECMKKASPNEAFGLVFGGLKELEVEGGYQYQYIGKQFKCIESDEKSPVAFFVRGDTEELFSIFKEAVEKFGMRLISIFHSHPSGAFPSGVDRYNMEHLNSIQISGTKNPFKYQVWSIMSAQSEKLNGFLFLNNEIIQVDIKIRT